MTVKELIEKLQKVDKNMQVMLHDGFSANATEIESVVSDNNQRVVIITPNEPSVGDGRI